MYEGEPMIVVVAVSAGIGARVLSADGELGDAEVEQLDRGRPVGTTRDEEVGRLEVSVDDPGRVHFGERLTGLKRDLARLRDRQRSGTGDELSEVAPLEVLHDDVGHPVVERAHVVDAGDVVAPDHGGDAGFAEESARRRSCLRRLGQEKLDGDVLLEPEVRRRARRAASRGR
jgi:hypothetical protein